MAAEDLPGSCVVFYEVPGGRKVLAGEVPTHTRKCHLHVALWDFASGGGQINKDEKMHSVNADMQIINSRKMHSKGQTVQREQC